MSEPLLSVAGLIHRFQRSRVAVLNGVSFTLAQGETLALVGPSGSGKSTLARVLVRLLACESGSVRFKGEDWLALHGRALRRRRAEMQMVFQDPLAAFNPRATVAHLLGEPLRIHKVGDRKKRAKQIADLLERVGLAPDMAARSVHELSGGQRQRVAIARAIATRPALIVLDEAVSALDVTVRAQILALLAEIQKQDGTSYLFITHDLPVALNISHRIAVMDAGRIVETGPAAQLIAAPQSDIAKALVKAAPRLRAHFDLIGSDRRSQYLL